MARPKKAWPSKPAVFDCKVCQGTGWEVPHPDYRVCRTCVGSGFVFADGKPVPEKLTTGWKRAQERINGR